MITLYIIIYGKRPDSRHLQTFESHAYVPKPRKARQIRLDYGALHKALFGHRRGNDYKVLQDDRSIIVESKNVRMVECIEPGKVVFADNDDV